MITFPHQTFTKQHSKIPKLENRRICPMFFDMGHMEIYFQGCKLSDFSLISDLFSYLDLWKSFSTLECILHNPILNSDFFFEPDNTSLYSVQKVW